MLIASRDIFRSNYWSALYKCISPTEFIYVRIFIVNFTSILLTIGRSQRKEMVVPSFNGK